MIVGTDKVLEYLVLTKCKHFRIYRGSNGKTPVFFYEEAGGTEVCKSQFNQWADLNNYSQPIEYAMVIYPKGKPTGRATDDSDDSAGSSRDTIRVPFYLVSPTGAMPMQNQLPAVIPGMMGTAETQEEMAKRIREEIESEIEYDDLYEEVQEMKNSQAQTMAGISKIIGYITPMLDGLFGGDAAAAPALGHTQQAPPRAAHLAGTPDTETRVNPEVMRLTRAINTLKEKDPDIVVHLEKLAHMSQNNPVMFTSLISMLNGF